MRPFKRPITGFTLIELMIVVAIIGILVSIGIVRYNSLVHKSEESTTRGNVGVMRSALAIYYSDNEQYYPSDDLSCMTNNNRYLDKIQAMKTPPSHPPNTLVINETTVSDSGAWSYNNNPNSTQWGVIRVGCLHEDSRGAIWSAF